MKKIQIGIYAVLVISVAFNLVVFYEAHNESEIQSVHGVTPSELAFLAKYRTPLIDESQVNDPVNLPAYLRQAIESSYNEIGHDLSAAYSLSENSAKIAHALLRVNGSIPVYKVRGTYASNVQDALLWSSGNCSDYSLRLMMVLESIGLKSGMISNVTKAVPGHVIVDAYDPETDTAYLLDANFNVMIEMPESGGDSFVETLLKMDAGARDALANDISISALPVYFNFADPGLQAYSSNAITVDILNSHRSTREKTWRDWLANDLDELRQWWVKAPGHAPNTLGDIRSKWLATIPDVFDRSGVYAQKIKTAAGLTN